MASSGPDVCCQQGFRYEGQPQGETKQINLLPGSTSTIHQVNAYFSYPETGHKGDDDKAVLILTDIFGLYENTQLLADAFAAEGYVAVVPDLFSGDAATFDAVRAGNFVLQSWISQHTTAQIDPIIASIIHYLRQELALKRIAGAGYCFGAKYVCRFLKPNGLDVGYHAHPSFVTKEELAGISGPISIAAAEHDHIFTTSLRHESEEILANSQGAWQLNLFGGVEHGFALRADLTDTHQKWAKEQAFYQAVSWFRKYL